MEREEACIDIFGKNKVPINLPLVQPLPAVQSTKSVTGASVEGVKLSINEKQLWSLTTQRSCPLFAK